MTHDGWKVAATGATAAVLGVGALAGCGEDEEQPASAPPTEQTTGDDAGERDAGQEARDRASDSPDSPESRTSPDSPDSPGSPNSPESPDSPGSPNSPDSPDSPDSPS